MSTGRRASTSSSVRITVVVDNHARADLKPEHGLALWIEAEGKRILFDTGAGEALEPNAKGLGIDLAGTDRLVLSHGHYDHAGGIPELLRLAPNCEVHCHPAAMRARYSVRSSAARAIGMQRASALALERLPPERLHWVSGPALLSERIGLSGPIPRETDYEDSGGPFFLDPDGKRPDPIEDDLSLWLRTDGGLVVCLGCGHAGVVNTLTHVRRLAGNLPIRAVIGGFHLMHASEARVGRTIAALGELAPAQIIPCHCTGDRAGSALAAALGGRVLPGEAGAVYCF